MEEILRWLDETWGAKTLAELREETFAEPTGLVYTSLRLSPGSRVALLLCATGDDWLDLLTRIFDFDSKGKSEDWTELTVFDVTVRTIKGSGIGFEDCFDGEGKRSAIVLIATEPRSIEILEKVLGLT